VLGTVCAGLLLSCLSLTGIAYAGPGGSCASGRVCLYENNDFNGGNTDHWRDFTADAGDFNRIVWLDNRGSSTNDHMDNETSSERNRRGCSYRLWQNVGSSGASTVFANGVDDGFLANNDIGDNRASAIDLFC
jgi:S-formylglutathione hydrolase FrmB